MNEEVDEIEVDRDDKSDVGEIGKKVDGLSVKKEKFGATEIEGVGVIVAELEYNPIITAKSDNMHKLILNSIIFLS